MLEKIGFISLLILGIANIIEFIMSMIKIINNSPNTDYGLMSWSFIMFVCGCLFITVGIYGLKK